MALLRIGADKSPCVLKEQLFLLHSAPIDTCSSELHILICGCGGITSVHVMLYSTSAAIAGQRGTWGQCRIIISAFGGGFGVRLFGTQLSMQRVFHFI